MVAAEHNPFFRGHGEAVSPRGGSIGGVPCSRWGHEMRIGLGRCTGLWAITLVLALVSCAREPRQFRDAPWMASRRDHVIPNPVDSCVFIPFGATGETVDGQRSFPASLAPADSGLPGPSGGRPHHHNGDSPRPHWSAATAAQRAAAPASTEAERAAGCPPAPAPAGSHAIPRYPGRGGAVCLARRRPLGQTRRGRP